MVVEDDGIISQHIEHSLVRLGYEVVGLAGSGQEAVTLALECQPEVILMDIGLPSDLDGIGAAAEIHSQLDVPIIYLTAFADAPTVERAKLTAPAGYLRKPFDDQNMRAAIEIALYKHSVDRQLRQSQELAQRERDQAQQYLDIAGVLIAALDCQGCITLINRRGCEILGAEESELLGKNWFETCLPEDTQQETFKVFQRIISGEIESQEYYENRVLTRRGEQRILAFHNALIFDENGAITGTLSSGEDITERKQVEAALALERQTLARRVEERTADLSIANAELARAARLKDEFLASMSHELRTPLTGVLGLSEALQKNVYGELTPRQMNALKSIEESGRHLLSLINDILDLSKIEAGKVELEIRPVSLAGVCNESMLFIRQSAQKKSLKVSTSYASDVSQILADERRLKQILVNLLSNAVKFTPEGGSIGLEMCGHASDRCVELTVWDTGIGIAEEDMPRLFKPFVQLDSSLSRAYNGSGLGLSLVLRMTELHGGSVAVASEPGKGSRFSVYLPWNPEDEMLAEVGEEDADDGERLQEVVQAYLKAERQRQASHPRLSQPEQTAAAQPDDSLASVQSIPLSSLVGELPGSQEVILLAEDNELTLNTISDFLKSRGFQVSAARNGQEALERAHELKPAVILMDIQMPVLDGLEATRRLRQAQDTQHTPVIALTALAMPGDRQRCLDAGANAYLSKPVNLDSLVDLIRQFRAARPREA
jgi:PAS domain S-box-containing protein